MAPTLPGSYGGPPLSLRGRSLLQAHADYAEELLDDAGWSEPIAIVGSSHGGVTALELAARGRASGVIAFAPPWMTRLTMTPYGTLGLIGGLPLRILRPLDARGSWNWTPAAVRGWLGGLVFQFSPRALAISDDDILATLRSIRDWPYLQSAPQVFSQPLLPELARIACPVTLVWGTADRAAPMWMAKRWLHALPQAELITLPEFRHVPHLTDPDRVSRLILDVVTDATVAN
jgi:pimeloyl-ACP methyl ester carboxylesterase